MRSLLERPHQPSLGLCHNCLLPGDGSIGWLFVSILLGPAGICCGCYGTAPQAGRLNPPKRPVPPVPEAGRAGAGSGQGRCLPGGKEPFQARVLGPGTAVISLCLPEAFPLCVSVPSSPLHIRTRSPAGFQGPSLGTSGLTVPSVKPMPPSKVTS